MKATFTDGVMFDGSSIAGWKAINESDMILMPDPSTAVLDPFTAQTTLILICDVVEPSTGQLYARCPRSTAKRAEAFMKSSGIGDTAVFGPELEFFVFDDVRFKVEMSGQLVHRSPRANRRGTSNTEYEGGNMGHRPGVKGGYFPVQPVDSHERPARRDDVGLHRHGPHHGNPPPRGGAGAERARLPLRHAGEDRRQRAEVQVRAAQRRPQLRQDADLHAEAALRRQRLGHALPTSRSGRTASRCSPASGYADLSETALYYIGGIIKHAKALNAFTNASTNSYKRVIPGFEAPVLLAYSSRNRSASCRIPYVDSPKGKRVEVRFPDPSANPYLAFAAMLMAGLDGIQNKIHPGDPMDKNLYDLPPEELSKVPTVAGSLREALNCLDADRTFLTKGGVFTDDQIDAYMELKWEEVYNWEHQPAPIEYKMYYSI